MAEGSSSFSLSRLSLAEKILGAIGVLIIIGWILGWSQGGFGFKNWFPLLSFPGALVVVALLILKLLGKKFLPEKMENLALSIASLAPVVGFMIWQISSPASFLTVGGSIALAYISATTYWRKHIPSIAMDPLGAGQSGAASPAEPEKKAPQPPAQ